MRRGKARHAGHGTPIDFAEPLPAAGQEPVPGSKDMQNNVIPIKRDNQAALAKLYLHLLTAAINEAAASAAQQTWPGQLPIHHQALLRARGAQGHCLTAHSKLSSTRKTGDPAQG